MSATDQPKSVVSVPRPPAYPLSTGQEIDLHGHRWVVKGIHLGALGQESLIHLEGLSHEPGWTGPWEFHPMLFVPEIMLSAALAAAPLPQGDGEPVAWRYKERDCRDITPWSYRETKPHPNENDVIEPLYAQPAPAPQGEDGWSELERLARAAYHDYALADIAVGGGMRATVSVPAFISAASPSTILKLIAAARSLPDSLATMEKVDG